MDLYAFPPIAALLDGAHAVLMGLADLLEPLVGVSSAAAAVVLVTLLVRAALIPVGISQAKAERTRARLAPRLAALQRKHQKNPELLQREMMSLYRSEGPPRSPVACRCSSRLRSSASSTRCSSCPRSPGTRTNCSRTRFFGVPLGSSLAGSIASGTVTPDVVLVFGAVIVMIAAIGEVTRRVFRPHGHERADRDGRLRRRGIRFAAREPRRAAPAGSAAVHHRRHRGVRAARGRSLPARHRRVDAGPTDAAAPRLPVADAERSMSPEEFAAATRSLRCLPENRRSG